MQVEVPDLTPAQFGQGILTLCSGVNNTPALAAPTITALLHIAQGLASGKLSVNEVLEDEVVEAEKD